MMNAINLRMKKRRGMGLVEIMIWTAVVLIFLYAMMPRFVDLLESSRRTATIQDMRTMAEQCALYAAKAADGQPPAHLGELVTGLSAAQTTDGIAYPSFIATSRYTSDPASFVDKWNNPYQYDPDARTITSTMNGGTAHTESF